MQYIKGLIKFFASTLILFLLLEVTARFYYFGLDVFDYTKINSFRGMGVAGVVQASPNPIIYYELKPNLDAYLKMAPFKTNSVGLRDKEYSIKKPDDTYRVAVMGSSFTMPAGVANEGSFHSLIEQKLNSRAAKTRYEFINFAVGGYIGIQSLAALKDKALSYKPDLILFCGTPRTLYTEMYTYLGRGPYKEKAVRNTFQKSYLEPLAKQSLHRFYWALAKLFSSNENVPSAKGKQNKWLNFKKYFKREMDNRRDIKKSREGASWLFQQLETIKKDAQIPIIVVIVGTDSYFLPMADEINELATQFGLPVINTFDAFKDKRPDEFCVHKLDCHPNAAAHQLISDKVFSTLNELGFFNESPQA